jgi:glycosyltransferase involved in cell wall biosynthesis
LNLSFVVWSPTRCGGVKVIFEVANGLVERGHTVKIISPQTQDWFPLKAELIPCGATQKFIDFIPECDVVTATYCWTAYYVDAVKGRKGIPAYYCQHYEPLFFVDAQSKNEARRTYQLPLNLVANSPWLQAMLKETENRESTLVVPGVDLQTFKPQKNEHMPEKLNVLVYANYSPIKGFYDVTLPALHYAWRHFSKFEVHTYGAELPINYPFPHVHHKEMSDKELAELYGSSDLYVSGSYSESSPLPHLEAMASGCPVVCTSVGTEHYGDSLLRVAPRRPRELGAKIVELLKDGEKRAEMRKRGLEDVKQFTWKRTVDGAESFFKELVGE